MKDIIIIGGGVIGCAIARELSRYQGEALLLEKGNDVSVGTSKANSGIVHAGHDAKPGSKKAYYNVKGNAMFDQLSKELDFPFRRNGSMVLCFDASQKQDLENLLERGKQNGVEGLYIVDGDEARKIEPYLSQEVAYALIVPSGGIVSPYEMAIAYAENACVNGVEFRFESQVVGISKENGIFTVTCSDGYQEQAKAVINCAGVYADEIANMLYPSGYKVQPRKGDYLLLDKACGYLADHTLFQMPTKMGKGILVTPTTHGNILVGPTATDRDDKNDVNTTVDELNDAFAKALLTMPTLSKRNVITQFSGLRAHTAVDDFIIEESPIECFYNLVGIESPGLTATPAIAVDVANWVSQKLSLQPKTHFQSTRKGIPQFSKLSNTERQKLIDANPLYGNIVCRCEVVTEGEIVDAIRRPVGAKDLDGVKRRTRAGMGRCQAGFCTPRIMEIIARELNIPLEEVSKRGGNSQVVKGRTK